MLRWRVLLISILISCSDENTNDMMMNNGSLLASEHNILETQNVLWLPTARIATMYQEGGGASDVPVTPVTTDGDAVGLIYDLSQNASTIRNSAGATTLPTLDSDGTRNSFLHFDGSNDRQVVQSTTLFNPIHSTNPVFSMYFYVKFNGKDGGTHIVMANGIGGTQTGFQVTRNTSNKLLFSVRTSAGTYYSVTSTSNFTVADGWQGVIISVNGSGTGLGRLIVIDDTNTIVEDQTFNTNGTGSSADATEGIWIGWRSGLTAGQQLDGDFGDLIIKPIPTTAQLIEAFRTYNPVRTAIDFSPILQNELDFDDTNYLFSDAGGTTPVTDGGFIRVVKTKKSSNFGLLNRGLTSAADATAPLWQDNEQNGFGVAEFDGIDTNFDFNQTFIEEQGGKWTLFIVAKNTDNTNGSHVLYGNHYVVLTGAGYGVGNNPRWACHFEGAGSSIGIDGTDIGNNTAQIVALTRDGSNQKIWNGDLSTSTNSTNLAFTFSKMGQDRFGGANDWWFQGQMIYIEKYNGVLSDLQVEARIAELNLKYNLP